MQPVSFSESLTERIKIILRNLPPEYAAVSIARQTLVLIKNEEVRAAYDISTSKYGTGNRENSLMTPAGIHRIAEKYGHGAPLGRVFVDRLDTGRTWAPGMREENLVLTRILRLEGLEDGVNRGPGIDSYERYIYIHGTSQEERIGTPLSHGCVCMRNRDVAELFNKVEVGTIVLID